MPEQAHPPTEKGNGVPTSSNDNEWYHLQSSLMLKGRVSQLAKHTILHARSENMLELHLDEASRYLHSETAEVALKKALEQSFGYPITLKICIEKVNRETPADQDARLIHEKQIQIEQTVEVDPFVQALQTQLGAVLIPGSIKLKESL